MGITDCHAPLGLEMTSRLSFRFRWQYGISSVYKKNRFPEGKRFTFKLLTD